MAKSFIKKHQDLVKSCVSVLEGISGICVLPEDSRLSISWCNCDGDCMIDTVFGVDSEFVYASDNDDVPDGVDVNDFITECNSICFDEISTESLCQLADLVCKLNG